MNMRKKYSIVIWGSGGISRETAFLIEEINRSPGEEQFDILGFIEKDDHKKGQLVSGYPVLGTWEILNDMDFDGYVVPAGNPDLKRKIVEEEVQKVRTKMQAFNLIHPSVIMRKGFVSLGIGNVIGAGTVLTTEVTIGDYNLINLNCTIGHDANIGNFNVINPLAAVSGGVQIGHQNLIGTGACILQDKVIGDHIVVGAGAVVVKNLHQSGIYIGVPARRYPEDPTEVPFDLVCQSESDRWCDSDDERV